MLGIGVLYANRVPNAADLEIIRPMARRSQTFKQRDVTRAVKAVRHAGMNIGRVEIDKDGKIVVIPEHDGIEHVADPSEWAIPK